MAYITYQEMLDRYGYHLAQVLLRSLERSAKINIVYLDHEARLRHALNAMRDNGLAA